MDLRTAVNLANRAIYELYPEDVLQNLLLEEVEREVEATGEYWYVTLGFDRPLKKESGAQGGILPNRSSRRTYKRFKIEEGSEEVVGMRDRELELD